MRTFIAIPTSQELQHSLSETQAVLQSSDADVRWEEPDKFHITLKFLGETPSERIPLIEKSMSSVAETSSPFNGIFVTAGAFPHANSPRILWLGVQQNQALRTLQSAIEQACAALGFPQEEHIFHPHITVGRVKSGKNIARLTSALKTCTFEPIHFRCTEFVFMKSELRAGGSLYTKLTSFTLHP
jgi:RNA 2',3'-cyclic 3'-phosphodiesterase